MKHLLAIAMLFWFLKPAQPPGADLSSSNSKEVNIQWDSTKNWKLYKLSNFNHVFRIPADSLQFLQGEALSDDSMHLFLSNAKKIEGVNPMWQGCYLASYQTADGQTHKAIISHYAGFFYCQEEKVYYQVGTSVQRNWLEYLSDSYVSIKTIGQK